MSRYFSCPKAAIRPRADWYDNDGPMIPHLEVDDHEPVDTGLLDVSGNCIMRSPNPMGFGRDDEW